MCDPSIIQYICMWNEREERAGRPDTHHLEFRAAPLVNAGIQPDNLWQ